MRITLKTIEESIAPLGGRVSYDIEFIFELLAAYGRSAGNITRLKNGSLNVAEDKDRDVVQKNIVFFRPVTNDENLYEVIDTLKSDQAVVRYSTRFVIVTDYEQLLAIDTKTNETLDIPIREINKYFTFFLPWAGMEKALYVGENHADIKAAYKMSKLFDEIVSYNHHANDANYWHGLNVFFSRLLFCFFAEDTEIFEKGQFTRSIESHTQFDGSDLAEYLDELFFAFDAEDKEGYPAHIAAFPYVNGGLFHESHESPKFNTKARQLLVECGSLDWSDINPDIFGSMIQAVVNPGQRAGLGMHYTSVPNIMKTIEPLFLDELKEAFNKYYDDKNRLERLLTRISNIKVFDPACGSGNFLIIAYKELRKLEHALLQRIDELSDHHARLEMFSRINIENFYGIEIDDFAHEVAILSLWLAKHQMNLEFKQKFGAAIALIPLKESGNIVRGNAARLDWNKVCPNEPHLPKHARLQQGKLIVDDHEQAQLLNADEKEWDEIYLISNPPYLGGKLQDANQKKDAALTLGKLPKYKDLDYIAIWFYKAAVYLRDNHNAGFAFVSTNSLFQGTQVPKIWPYILECGLEITFAFKDFKWTNNATNSAAVICSIVGVRKVGRKYEKFIEESTTRKTAANVNPYLIDAPNLIIESRTKSMSGFPPMLAGNSTYDDGHLILSREEYRNFIQKYPELVQLIKKLSGSYEFINGIERYCFWIDTPAKLELANKYEEMRHRFDKVREFRKNGGSTAQTVVDKPWRFALTKTSDTQTLLIPRVSSNRREYFPMGLVGPDTIVLNSAYAIFDASLEIFGLLTSKMHLAWTRLFAGRLKSDVRYSTGVVYNTFPIRPLTEHEKQDIKTKVISVLDAREQHSEMTLAEMYDPDKMPEDLRAAHHELDEAVDGIYRKKPFENDEERLAHLFGLYEQMTAKEKDTILV